MWRCFPNGLMLNPNEHSWNGCKSTLSILDRMTETCNYKHNKIITPSYLLLNKLKCTILINIFSLVWLSMSIRIFPFGVHSHEMAHEKAIKPRSSWQAKEKQMNNTFKEEGIRGKESSFMFLLILLPQYSPAIYLMFISRWLS